MLPLLAAAIATGGVKGITSALSGFHQKKVARQAIKANYRRNERDLSKSQQDIRNTSNEDLANRGLLNSGASPRGVVGNLAQAYATGGPLKGRPLKGVTTQESGWQARSANGGVGLANTIAGGLSDTMTKEFYQEHEDLWRGQKDQLKALPTDLSIMGGAAAEGVGTGASLYSAMSGAGTSAPAPAGASGVPAAYGIDPVNPIAALDTPNYSLTAPVKFTPPTARY